MLKKVGDLPVVFDLNELLVWIAMSQQNSLCSRMGELRETLFSNRLNWLVRLMCRPQIRYLPAEEIISRNCGALPSNDPLPPKFLERFNALPLTAWDVVLKNVGWGDIYRMQLVAGKYRKFIGKARRNYPLTQLVHGSYVLKGTETVRVNRYTSHIEISHAQLEQSLANSKIETIEIEVLDQPRADLFHIPSLKCRKLDMRLREPIVAPNEQEMLRVFQQIVDNPYISEVTMIGKCENNHNALRTRIEQICHTKMIPANVLVAIIQP